MTADVYLTVDIPPFEIVRPSDRHTLLVLAAVWELRDPGCTVVAEPAIRYPTLAAAEDMQDHLYRAGRPMLLAVRILDSVDLTAAAYSACGGPDQTVHGHIDDIF